MGAGGTGKTTTAEVVAKHLNIVALKSASRTVYEREELTEELCAKLADEQKFELQFRIFAAKQEMDKTNYTFVADRTLLDHWAYCLLYCANFMPNKEFDKFEEGVRVHMLTQYTHLFYFPWGYWAPAADGVRSEVRAWQSAVDALIAGYIQRWRLPVKEAIQLDGREARARAIFNQIQSA
jgi:hypothetical protein